MKFVETLEGNFINWEHVLHVTAEEGSKESSHMTCYITLPDTSKLVYIEFPNEYTLGNGDKKTFNITNAADYITVLISYIKENNYNVFRNFQTDEAVSHVLFDHYQKKMEEKVIAEKKKEEEKDEAKK